MPTRNPERARALANLVITDAEAPHVAEITRIYANYVATHVATFEEVPPDEAEMRSRFDAIRAQRLPWLVALRGSSVVGYAYVGLYRARAAYRYTCENSVYVDASTCGLGIGRALLDVLAPRAAASVR